MTHTNIRDKWDRLRYPLCRLVAVLQSCWKTFNGDAAYERYLAHWQTHTHAADERPLDRKAFFAAETQRKWNGVKRCC
ncbi:MAG: YbdD/YjiX family protein [Gammaproteobacteria bacterium]